MCLVAILNLAYFGVEFTLARTIGSVSLFADSIDFLEDASVNFLNPLSLSLTGAGALAITVPSCSVAGRIAAASRGRRFFRLATMPSPTSLLLGRGWSRLTSGPPRGRI